MEVILDELTPVEFFAHGGIVKITITDDELIKECNIKKKLTFFDHKSYVRFFKNLYLTHLHNHSEQNSYEVYKFVNKNVELKPSIGQSEYVVDLNYDRVRSYETAKFYYSNDKNEMPEVSPRDPYGIQNVCFSLMNENDDRWDEFEKQRLERGFDSSELWSLDGTIARFIYPRLKAFLENVKEEPSYPTHMTFDEWVGILEKMVNGFELMASDRIKTKDEEDLEEETLKLFCEHFFNLWI